MNREHGGEGQSLIAHQHRDKGSGPIVAVQNFRGRRHAPGELDRGLAEKDKASGVIRVGLAAFLVNSRSIVKLIAANEENLQVFGRAAFKKIGHKTFFA